MVRFKGIVFDVDGVLVDSEPLAFRAWNDLVASHGFTLDDSDFQALLGIDLESSTRYILWRTGIPTTPEEIIRDFWLHLFELLPDGLAPLPGVQELVQSLAQSGFYLGVASNSIRSYVERVLDAIHLRDYFPVVMGRDQVGAGKPAPDLYLAAVAEMGCSPRDCLAVEDSPVGLRAALAAGLHTILISARRPPEDLRPWKWVKSFEEINQIIYNSN